MALPPEYSCSKHYLSDCLDFLETYKWIFVTPNTHILAHKTIEQFPRDWCSYFEKMSNETLNNLALGILPTGAVPPSLKEFVDTIRRLNVKITTRQSYHGPYKCSGLSEKKIHEIVALAPLIHEAASKSDSRFIVDVGAGLGYLPMYLYDKFKYDILAIEGDPNKIPQAENRLNKNPECRNHIQLIQHFVTENSSKFINELITDQQNVCMTGLHACADLSVTMLDLFIKLSSARSLVLMPCCYHRMKRRHDSTFINFPKSASLRDLSKSVDFLNVAFLRLACQMSGQKFSRMSWAEHQEHARNEMFRAILQEVAECENCEVSRLKRKSGLKSSTPEEDPFELYLQALAHTHTLTARDGSGKSIADPEFLSKMREKWSESKRNLHLFSALSALQTSIQAICENVVLLDRVVFLQEAGIQCLVAKVTDEGISPRCHALIATKTGLCP